MADIIAWSIRRSIWPFAPDNGAGRTGLNLDGVNLLEVAKTVLEDMQEPPRNVLASIQERINCNEQDARTIWNACVGSMIASGSADAK
ncbi:hypothetical protein ACFQE0_25970 [Methylobacterium komagatae]|uniref:Uncharacterized protein n=1 Tax=Methylobacterium komagatae TaxID=374425 RepID=A0ABW2BR65_9HYPH